MLGAVDLVSHDQPNRPATVVCDRRWYCGPRNQLKHTQLAMAAPRQINRRPAGRERLLDPPLLRSYPALILRAAHARR